jgi:hypothetical protein
MGRCKAMTMNNRKCKNKRLPEGDFCATHQRSAFGMDIDGKAAAVGGGSDDDGSIATSEATAVGNQEHVLELERRLAEMEIANQRLAAEVERKSLLLSQAQTSLIETQDTAATSVKKVSSKRIAQRARALYYKDTKDNPEIVAKLKEAMKAGSLLVEVTKTCHGQLLRVDNIPWQFKKTLTNDAFEKLPDADKQAYMIKAQLSLEAKQQ